MRTSVRRAGLVFTGWFGFVQLRKFRLAVDVVRGKYDEKGSAVAVSIGGPGATFWMILCGLLSMATKFVEVTLGVKYREVHADGTVSGGPMHYLPRAWPSASVGTARRSARSSRSSPPS